MPSKGKKKPKSPPSSPGTPSTPRTPNLQTPNPHRGKIAASPLSNSISNKHVDIKFFSVVASEYPSLIPNVDSAFYGNISGSDSHKEGNKAFVYLSESAFTDFSAKPGSVVLVWLVPLEDQLEGDDRKVNNAGNCFSIATIFPSSKMLKDGVRLSWDLSCTLDFPSKGRSIFISPLSSNFCIKKCDKLNLSLSKTEGDNELSDDSAAWLAIEDERIKASLQEYALRWLNGRQLLKGNIIGIPIGGKTCLFKVEDNDSGGFYALSVDGSTKVEIVSDNNGLLDSGNEEPDKDGLQVENDDVAEGDWPTLGGLSKEFTDLKEIISFSLAKNQSFSRYKGVLLYGPPGTGKTSLACLCAKNAGAQLFTINGPEIVSQYYGESEQTLHHIFDSAKKSAPSVVFIDELDAIAPARKDGNEELSLRMVATLLKLMDEIHRNDRVLLIAATNRPDSLDPALRRPGRLDREIEIGVPSPEQRLDILVTLMSKMDHSLSASQLNSLASETHGFVGADLAALCNEAALNALRHHINSKGEKESSLNANVSVMSSLSESLSKLAVSENVKREDEDPDLVVRFEDFKRAKLKIRPSAMREVMLELPKVRWEDVGGQSKLKTQLIEAVQWPQTNPEALTRLGIRAPRGLLMTGPPGCSKTLMARAVASEAKLNFLAVKGPELLSKWVGESEKAVKKLFEKARVNSPAIIFFDEIDGLAGTRGEGDGVYVGERVLTQLLVEMDGLDSGAGVTVVGATNRPDKIDPALLRPGRFDRLLDVQPPDEMDREDIFRIHTRNIPCGTDVKLNELAILTHGYTGADIKLVCREAAISALEEDIDVREISMRHFEGAIGKVHPSDLKFYQDLATQFRRLVDSTSITA